jgi:hypothetical protein
MRIQNSQLVAAKVSKLEFRGKEGKFPRHFNGLFQLGMCEFDPSQVSQPVRRSEKLPPMVAEMPANSGLLRIGYRSPGSIFDPFHGVNAESLRPYAGLFPFSGDRGWSWVRSSLRGRDERSGGALGEVDPDYRDVIHAGEFGRDRAPVVLQ